MRKRAFTLLELLVVIAMIALLTGVVGAAVNGARRRAKFARAQAEAQEITNAILSYANYTKDGTLASVTMENQPASKTSLNFLLGGQANPHGGKIPVLYNGAPAPNGEFLDPWGHPYRVTVKEGQRIEPEAFPELKIRLFFPNWHRLGGNE